MRTTISIPFSPKEAVAVKKIAVDRGFKSTSDYVRFLITEDRVDLISESELLRRVETIPTLKKQKKLISAKSLLDLV